MSIFTFGVCPAATDPELKFLGSNVQSDGDMNAVVNKKIQCGLNNSCGLLDKDARGP